MVQIIRAVYEHGQLRPLDPLALTDGQEIRLAILSEREQVRSALADLLAPVHAEPAEEMDEAALVATVDAALQDQPPVSEVLLTERHEGPFVAGAPGPTTRHTCPAYHGAATSAHASAVPERRASMSTAVMVTMTFDPRQRAEIVAHVPAEQAGIRDLRAQGAVDALYIAEAQDRVWLVVRGETLDAVRDIVASLPLHAYATVELAPLAGPPQ